MEEQESGNSIIAVLPVQLLWLLVINIIMCTGLLVLYYVPALAGPSLWVVSDMS